MYIYRPQPHQHQHSTTIQSTIEQFQIASLSLSLSLCIFGKLSSFVFRLTHLLTQLVTYCLVEFCYFVLRFKIKIQCSCCSCFHSLSYTVYTKKVNITHKNKTTTTTNRRVCSHLVSYNVYKREKINHSSLSISLHFSSCCCIVTKKMKNHLLNFPLKCNFIHFVQHHRYEMRK